MTGQPELDDKILHYALVFAGMALMYGFKASLEYLGKKEVSWVLKLFRRKKNETRSIDVPFACQYCPNRATGAQQECEASDTGVVLFV